MTTLLPLRRAASSRDKALKSLDRLPPLSPAESFMLSKLAFRNVDFKELAALVEKDAALCAHLVKTVNSGSLARSRIISSPRQAMTILGVNPLRRIAIGFTVARLFSSAKSPPSWSRTRFNQHSGSTALLTEAIVDALPIVNKEGAFVAGMLHDIGSLLIALALPEEYETIAALSAVSSRLRIESEHETLGTDHAELSGVALSRWGLPDLICRSVYHHHTPEDHNATWLATVIHRADRFVSHYGITVMPPATMRNAEPPSMQIPGFEYDRAAVLKRFDTEWRDLATFFR